MRKFDLEQAKAGDPVCTRDGRPVKIFTFEAKSNKPLLGMICGKVEDVPLSWREDGKIWMGDDSEADLMMADREEVRWIMVLQDKGGCYHFRVYDTEEEAKNNVSHGMKVMTITKISWKE